MALDKLKQMKVIAEILKKRFGNLTVSEVLDLSGEILDKLEEAEKVSEGRDKPGS